MQFNSYPFQKLRELLKDIHPSKQGENLSIGEPSFPSPSDVVECVKNNASLIRYYPKALDDLKYAQMEFVKNRFNISLQDSQIVPTFGSREVLFNFTQYILLSSIKNVLAFPNPFYQIYEGGAIVAKSKIIYMPIDESNNFKPHLPKELLDKVGLVILNSPNNPTGQILEMEELQEWVNLALKYDFVILNDECYSEIYMDKKPPSILEASIKVGNTNFKNVFAINSISKRLSCPGLRSGFIAGSANVLKGYNDYRSFVGISMPLTLQHASALAWRNNEYAEEIRIKFAKNIMIAKEIFEGINIFPYTFYMWLKVQDCNEAHLNARLFNDELFVKELYKELGHIVLPGTYLGNSNAGIGRVRIALTKDENTMRNILLEIKAFYDNFIAKYPCDKV